MSGFLLAGFGGFIGAATRYGINVALARVSAGVVFPLATLVVNVVGSFLIGWIIGGVGARALSHDLRIFLVVGILGGFTTFSSFSAETLQLWREVSFARAASNVALNVSLCLAAVYVGDMFARWVRA